MPEDSEPTQAGPPDAESLQAAFEEVATVDPEARRQQRQRRASRDKRKKVSNARSALLAVVVLSALTALLYLAIGTMTRYDEALISSAVFLLLTAVYVGFYVWARRQPYPALLTGLLIYAALILLDVGYAVWMMDPPGPVSMLLRVLIVFFLIRGFLAARQLRGSVNH